ncbi:DNA cytosine methyltransferase [Defluviimonas sp. WL0002]|uniref:DNA (cytosine-5-)-methyltransferase n=1 Tax=Albidovulum marisflavi TaxID=2984159 RepID=A0ABT2ZI17_9RHOB|nr:DNA cytosine methyltransferase [Defluviimonas sp. WL0002]MCV2870667.1 DNA cytosine methyltransferase [Defluviimonas sp. WL0002]
MDGTGFLPHTPQRRLGDLPPIIVDSFAGGGGASTGIELALGRSPDVAINHDAAALAMHQANHPDTLHLNSNIWQVDPSEVCRGRRVGLAWFSPDCKHHSKAKGGKPVKKNIRDLAWVVVLWARRVRPEVILLENVEEFRDWGPLTADNRPCPERRGQTFKAWCAELKRLGYKVEHRELRACDYGAPTIRKRLFLVARRDGRPITWPEPTHGKPGSPEVLAGTRLPWRTAAEIIDWSLPCPSIFDTSEEIMAKHGLRAVRPLKDATMRRIARGVMRYVVDAAQPFIVSLAHGDSGGRREYPIGDPIGTQTVGGIQHGLVMPTLAPFVTYGQQGGANRSATDPLHTITASPKDQNAIVAPMLVQTGYGEAPGQAPRSLDIEAPLGTVVAGGGKHALVAAFLAQHNAGARMENNAGRPADAPLSTLTTAGAQQQVVSAFLSRTDITSAIERNGIYPAGDPLRTLMTAGSFTVVAAFLQKYYGAGTGQDATAPLHTVATRDTFGLVTVQIDGQTYAIADIGMRMLTPREQFRAQGFPDSYRIEAGADGRALTKTEQTRMCGNSVCPPLAEALVRANCAHLAASRMREKTDA